MMHTTGGLQNTKGKIALLVGESGSGKTTVANYLHDKYGFNQIYSYTTRAPRFPGEPGHVFVSNEEFDQLTNIIAYTEFDGKRYCATADQVDAHDLYVVDPAGVEFMHKRYSGKKDIRTFYFLVTPEELVRRMEMRGESHDAIEQRMENDAVMFANAYDRLSAVYPTVVLADMSVEDAASHILKFLKEEVDYECS